MATESTLSTFVAQDGDNIAVQDWPLDKGAVLRGVVLVVHGLGEHAGRYDQVAGRLNAWGFAVRGYDLYGHGESGGPRGGLSDDNRLLNDLADIIDSTRKHMPPGCPLILLGHSLGGLVAARFASLRMRPIDALILSSPALDPALNYFQKLLLALLPRIAPDLRVSNGLDVTRLSHDPSVVAAYKADKLVHDRISARLARFIAEAGKATLAVAPGWTIPTLLMYAGQDKLVAPSGSRAFTRLAPRTLVASHCFDEMYHEIFNEADPAPVFATLKDWLNERY
jgi:alpha-beta hydrolase superfamily lysophospholipase